MKRILCQKCGKKMLVAESGTELRSPPYICGRKSCKRLK